MFTLSSDGAPLMAKSSSIIKRPPEDVFRFVGERFFENYPRWSPEVVELTPLSDGPVGVGTMARQVRVDQGRRSESIFRVSVTSHTAGFVSKACLILTAAIIPSRVCTPTGNPASRSSSFSSNWSCICGRSRS